MKKFLLFMFCAMATSQAYCSPLRQAFRTLSEGCATVVYGSVGLCMAALSEINVGNAKKMGDVYTRLMHGSIGLAKKKGMTQERVMAVAAQYRAQATEYHKEKFQDIMYTELSKFDRLVADRKYTKWNHKCEMLDLERFIEKNSK